MTTVRDELWSFMQFDETDLLSPADRLESLEYEFGDAIIPGLTDCLDDESPLIRQGAVRILCIINPRPVSALSALLKRFDDEAIEVQIELVAGIGEFAHHGRSALPFLERWSDSPCEFLRIQALISIFKIDSDRHELMEVIKRSVTSSDNQVRELVQKFLAETEQLLPFHAENFKEVVLKSWRGEIYHWECGFRNGAWNAALAPAFQTDGSFAGLLFASDHFRNCPGVEVFYVAPEASGTQNGQNELKLEVAGRFFGEMFVLVVHFQPIQDLEVE